MKSSVMTTVMAQGVFDVLHPGHLFYLEESAKLGDKLYVVLARDSRIKDRKELLMSEDERLQLVSALEIVDHARLGTENDIYDVLEDIDPDILTIGHDQPYDLDEINQEQEKRGFHDIENVRTDEYDPAESEIVSSSTIKRKLKER
jgi:FAD synthetase